MKKAKRIFGFEQANPIGFEVAEKKLKELAADATHEWVYKTLMTLSETMATTREAVRANTETVNWLKRGYWFILALLIAHLTGLEIPVL